jgi:hypothetical protein
MWPELVVDDKRGELIRDSAQCAAIAERLMHLTSEELVSSCNSSGTFHESTIMLCKDYVMTFKHYFAFPNIKDTDQFTIDLIKCIHMT